jgi:hypothetical protein
MVPQVHAELFLPVDHIFSAGNTITGLTATQISFAGGVSGVQVSFTQPSPPLQNGYRVTVGNGSPTTIQAPPVTVMATGMGMVNIRVEPLSRHYPIAAMEDTVTLNGDDNNIIF